jgi:hypothetical protein
MVSLAVWHLCVSSFDAGTDPHLVLQRTFTLAVVVRKIQTITDQILELVPNEEDRQILVSNIQFFRQSERAHARFMDFLKSLMDGSMPESLEHALQSFPIQDRCSFVEAFRTRVDQVLRQLAVESAVEVVEDNVSNLSGSGSGGGRVMVDDDSARTNGAVSRPRRDNTRLPVLAAANNQDGDVPAPMRRVPRTLDMEGSGSGDETIS